MKGATLPALSLLLIGTGLLGGLLGGCSTGSHLRPLPVIHASGLSNKPEQQTTHPTETGLSGSLNLQAGWSRLWDNDWGGKDNDQILLALEGSIGMHSPVELEFGIRTSYSDFDEPFDASDNSNTLFEAYVGPRYVFMHKEPARPYIGVGLSWVRAERSDTSQPGDDTDDDDSLAGYVHGGMMLDINNSWHFGMDIRYGFFSDMEIFGSDTDVDYLQITGFIGFNF